jgi:bacterioferritin-associated ferredoxin
MDFQSTPCVNRPGYLCRCLRVTEDQVREAVSTCDLQTIRCVTQATGAGGGCMACHRHIRKILNEGATCQSLSGNVCEQQSLCQQVAEPAPTAAWRQDLQPAS